MADIFPTGRFGFMEQEIDVERQTLEGGEAISGGSDKISTEGGGRVYAAFGAGELVDRATILAWRAVLGLLEDGVTPMVVPFCDPRHQPIVGRASSTYSDGTTHSDGTPFAGNAGGTMATASAAALRATTLNFNAAFAQPLIGGEWFTIDHAAKGPRAYKVRRIGEGTLSFVPPLREAIPNGTPLDFNTPRCLMVQDGRASAALMNRRQTTAAIRFVEAR